MAAMFIGYIQFSHQSINTKIPNAMSGVNQVAAFSVADARRELMRELLMFLEPLFATPQVCAAEVISMLAKDQ